MTRLLDVVMHYECNLACDYCTITPQMRTRSLSARQIAAAMQRARRDGITELSFTGGEPTIRGDLLPLIRAAKKLGFMDIKVQSNGLLFTPANVQRLRDAGVTRFHVSVHTHLKEPYERMVRGAAYDAMEAGLRALTAANVRPVADLIMSDETAPRLAGAVKWLAERDIRRARLWLISLTDGNRDRLHSLLPLDELMPHVSRAFEAADDRGLDLRSLHLPKCILGKYADRSEDPAAGGVRLITPDDERDLADAKLTPGAFVPACEGCPDRQSCRGLRADYLEVHGDAAVAHARGKNPAINPTRLRVVSES
ncbi:MAG: MoaA/NifB/PqqE/SkfB family radical SAM enzyme [Polyangiales bacterium]|jgi:MoaA/NifB/PqqE/SkfB family radical SAM enzyme